MILYRIVDQAKDALFSIMERERVAALRENVTGQDKRRRRRRVAPGGMVGNRRWREWPKAIGTPVEPM